MNIKFNEKTNELVIKLDDKLDHSKALLVRKLQENTEYKTLGDMLLAAREVILQRGRKSNQDNAILNWGILAGFDMALFFAENVIKESENYGGTENA